MQPAVAFCNLASAKYRAELESLRTLILAPLNLWQVTKSRLTYLDAVLFVSIEKLVDQYEQELIGATTIDNAYHSASKPSLCVILFACTHLLDCILELPIFGLNNLPSSIKTAIKTDFATCEKYICNLKFRQILDAYKYKVIQDLITNLTAARGALINRFEVENYINTYVSLLTSTTITLTGCNGNTYNILEYFEYISALQSEASQVCQECGISVDDSELTEFGKKLSIVASSSGAWGFALDSKLSLLETKIDDLIDRIDSMLGRANLGANSAPNTIPKDDLMK